MAANVETMMYTGREKPWHGLGTSVEEAPTSADALRLAGLDWKVVQKPVQVVGEHIIPNVKANVRSSDNSVLGVVSDRYKIVQNEEAFRFTDEIIGGDVRYDTAGSLNEGRKVWLLAKMPDVELLGDKTEPYLCFTNSHDGSGAIRVCMTPVRVVCNNTLNIALNTAKRQWSTKHVGDLGLKMHEAKHCLQMAADYLGELDEYAAKMADSTVTKQKIDEILDELFPLKDTDTMRRANTVKRMKDEFMVCYYAPDIEKFRGTAWGMVNAMSDMVSHNAPVRQTATYQENNWGRIMEGHVMMDKLVELLGVKN